jgi:hypothetical protein
MAGETTVALSNDPPFAGLAGMFMVPFSVSYATTELELNDVKELGYCPANCKVFALFYAPSDMDSGTALVQKVTIGSTDVVTTLNGGQTGAKSIQVFTPLSIGDAKQLVKVTTTTAAGTAVAGTLDLTLICQK